MEREAAELIGAVNHDIYEKRLADKANWPDYALTPHSMYFYYVRINGDGGLVVDHYFYVDGEIQKPDTWQQIPYDAQGLNDLVKKLATNARPSGGQDAPPLDRRFNNFMGIVWKRKSYIAIFFDEARWKFRTKGSGHSAVGFIVKEGSKEGTPNNTFFDAIDVEVPMPINGGSATDLRSGIVFVNHMKGDDTGRDLHDGEEQKFSFKLTLGVEFATGEQAPITVIIDPDGNNLGPPLSPP